MFCNRYRESRARTLWLSYLIQFGHTEKVLFQMKLWRVFSDIFMYWNKAICMYLCKAFVVNDIQSQSSLLHISFSCLQHGWTIRKGKGYCFILNTKKMFIKSHSFAHMFPAVTNCSISVCVSMQVWCMRPKEIMTCLSTWLGPSYSYLAAFFYRYHSLAGRPPRMRSWQYWTRIGT